MDRTDLDLSAIVADDAFLRSVSRGLLFDRSAAEDVAQEAWLATLRASTPPRGIRAFLGGAARNLAWKSLRGDGRRRARELAAARPEAVPSAASRSETEELRAQVVAAVDALAEPYRSAVLARHFEDLSPAEAARRLGVGVETFRTRLKRAYVQLRKRLDDGRPNRDSWASALLPLAGFPDAAAAAAFLKAAGASSMFAIGWKAAACVVLAAAATRFFDESAVPPIVVVATDGGTASPSAPVEAPRAAATPSDAGTAVARAPFVDRDAAAAPVAVDEKLVLTAADADGRTLRLGGACVVVDGAVVEATRIEGGGLAVPARPGKQGEVFAAAEGGALARRETALDGAALELVFDAAVSVRGRVALAAGAIPAKTALLGKISGDYAAHAAWPAEVVAALKLSGGVRATARADVAADGAFRLDGLAPGVRISLRATEAIAIVAAEGAEWDSLRGEAKIVAAPRERSTEVVLRAARPATLKGRVVDAKGAPVAKAGVALSMTEADGTSRALSKRADADGRFSFLLPPGVKAVTLKYGLPGGASRELKPETPIDVDRDLGDLPLGATATKRTIEVRDDAGKPVPGARVWVVPSGAAGPGSAVDAIRVDREGRATVATAPGEGVWAEAEGFAGAAFPVGGDAGAVVACVLSRAASVVATVKVPAGDDVSQWRVRLSAAAAAGEDAIDLDARADAQGRAVIASAPAGRPLTLTLHDACGGVRARTTITAVPGGAAVDIAPESVGARLRVRVVDPEGRPVPGIRLRPADPVRRHLAALPKSDADGVVECGSVAAPVKLVTEGKAFTAAPTECAPRGEEFTPFAVAPPRTVLLRGRDRNGVVRPLRAVSIDTSEPALAGGILKDEDAGDGAFRLTGLPAAPTAWFVYWIDAATGERRRARCVIPATGAEIFADL